ncbi:hypothetical protein Nhal_3668 [Nitrosococcus halophilus Nc 4]|uniref:Uncharacterized protein n=1 Tax=Nitrosococcus halophilus (strain Nc4) TaxID=472759 RepID=D5C2L3_NITHN|nr:hypothetical protein Nhal_3668 [Nitrosococcus halophilus Nc 4]
MLGIAEDLYTILKNEINKYLCIKYEVFRGGPVVFRKPVFPP